MIVLRDDWTLLITPRTTSSEDVLIEVIYPPVLRHRWFSVMAPVSGDGAQALFANERQAGKIIWLLSHRKGGEKEDSREPVKFRFSGL